MAKTPKTLLVPVDIWDGGILHDTDYHRGADSREEAKVINDELRAKGPDSYGHDQARKFGVSYVMEEVEPFTAELRVVKVGHKTAYVELVDRDGACWPMFTSDYVGLMSTSNITEGWIEARTYEVCKKASAYGIRAV